MQQNSGRGSIWNTTKERQRREVEKNSSEQHVQHDVREREKEALLKWQEGEEVKVRHWCTALTVGVSLERRRVLAQVDNTSQTVKIWFWVSSAVHRGISLSFLLPPYFISHTGFTQKNHIITPEGQMWPPVVLWMTIELLSLIYNS